jgi:L-threonylcarbamoyladenylate synthase
MGHPNNVRTGAESFAELPLSTRPLVKRPAIPKSEYGRASVLLGGKFAGMPAILDWRQAQAPDDLARQMTQALVAGEIVALPSEAGTVLVADPDRLSDPGRPPGLPDTLPARRLDGFFDPADFFTRVPPTPAERALGTRLWPGAVGWVHDDSPFPAWVPAHLVMASVLAARQSPLALFELADGRPIDPAMLTGFVNQVVTDGPARPGPITLIRPNDVRWTVERPGVLTEAAIRQALARRIVFVCTGNTCRSPMAEGLFKHRLAERLACSVDELPTRGFLVSSAGLAAGTGDAATADTAAALGDYGVDLSAHRSRPAGADLIARADEVIVMTRSHLVTVAGKYPILGGALRLLCGPDGDLDDPIGGGPEIYKTCAATILHHVDRLITELGLP